MLTPAQQHFQNVMAQRHGTVNGDVERTAYEQQLHRLRMDISRLSQVQSVKAKADVKRQLLPNYQAWVDGVIAADTGQADDVITTVMIWSIDAGDISAALRIGEYVLRHRLPLPDRYNRTAATTLVDEICDPVLAAFKADSTKAPLAADLLLQLVELTEAEDMPDQVRAKLYKAVGYTLRLDEKELTAAREWLQRAITLCSDIGVKRDIELLTRAIKKMVEPQNETEIITEDNAAGDTLTGSESTPVVPAATVTKPRATRVRKTGTQATASKTRTKKRVQ